MIKRLTARKLNGRSDFDLCFNEDMNILTGKNGCGKTTLLKLAWYMISGNLDRVAAEIDFEFASITTDAYTLSASVAKSAGAEGLIAWKFVDNVGNAEQFPSAKGHLLDIPREHEIGSLRRRLIHVPAKSVFFPTFRRVEGGFSLGKTDKQTNSNTLYDPAAKVEDAMRELSARLSEDNHRFVAYISTTDIEDMVTRQYAMMSQLSNAHNSLTSRRIETIIQDYTHTPRIQSDAEKLKQVTHMLDSIKNHIASNASIQEQTFQPFTALSNLIPQILRYQGIRTSSGVTLGKDDNAIPSDVLSAGEKQMLSFLAYNAFTRNSVIFIDEPEISLHVDWQRILFSLLESQGTNNQFIVATHSPFIYSKYVDKEIMLDKDRGE